MTHPSLTAAAAAPTGMLNFSDPGGPYAIAEAQFLSMVADITMNASSEVALVSGQRETLVDVDALVTAEWKVRSTWDLGRRDVRVLQHPDESLAIVSSAASYGEATAEVFSPLGKERAQVLLDGILGQCPPIEVPEGGLSVRFWYATSLGPRSVRREIDAPDWSDVSGNYTANVRDGVERMSAWRGAPPAGGRLLLAHGPAGTGKTFVLRTLAREWRDWAEVHVITDPDEFFGMSGYMLSVLLGEEDYGPVDGGTTGKWRLIVVEDCDEILSANARERSGHAVSRLLNVADGMVGQGLRVLLMLTTNETVENFHPAIVRPGRCLSNLYFGPMSSDEADAWRVTRGIEPDGTEATLARLYEQHRMAVQQRGARAAASLRAMTSEV